MTKGAAQSVLVQVELHCGSSFPLLERILSDYTGLQNRDRQLLRGAQDFKREGIDRSGSLQKHAATRSILQFNERSGAVRGATQPASQKAAQFLVLDGADYLKTRLAYRSKRLH